MNQSNTTDDSEALACIPTNPDPDGKHSPYYTTGAYLRAKHEQTHFVSGRQFQAWALGLLPILPSMHVLDAGCGWGRFTWQLIEAHSVPAANIVCADLSTAMLSMVHDESKRRNAPVKFCAGEIEALPFQPGRFDLVMANHVLYHLSSMATGLRELARLMKPQGYFLATTNSENIRVTIIELHYQALRLLGVSYEPEPPSSFSMESGAQHLSHVFREVNVFYFEDASVYQNVNDFVNMYLNIGRYRNFLAREDIPQATKEELPGVYKQLVQEIFDREGELRIPVLMGAFVCQKPGF